MIFAIVKEGSVRFEEMNWMDVENYLRVDDRIMVILGSTEQHGYLSLLTDVKIPLALADAASKQTGVIIAPPINFGVSPYFLAYPGTISLRTDTFLRMVEDLVTSLYKAGFRKYSIINGHGGNDSARAHLVELANVLPDVRFAWYSWWQSHSIEAVALRHEIKPGHANWLEAFPFTMVSELPFGEKNPPAVKGLLSAEDTRLTFGDGSFGGFYQVDQEIMNEIFSAALADVLHLLEFDS
jgi:creatinine amidohydrolase